MRTTFLPCLPTSGTSVPATPAWLHEVKYDGYRLIVQREGERVRLFSRNGNDWSHPLEETADGVRTLFYEEAEAVLAQVPKLGLGIVMRTRGQPQKWDAMSMARLVRGLREQLGLPSTFTLDACRHGGMTELEEAELTDGQGRALSAHKSKTYEGYAKRTEKRALAATRKRHAHRMAMEKQVEADAEDLMPEIKKGPVPQ
jgi:ATP dependent DNA ligase domain